MIEFQLDDKTFTLHETSAAAAEAAAQRAEAAAETVSGSVAQIAENKNDISSLKEDISYIYTAIDNGENIFNTLQLGGNNTAVASNGDGSYTIGTTDYGRSNFGAVLVKAGSYLLYGVPQGYSYLSTTESYHEAVVTNNTAKPKRIVLESDATLYLGYRITSPPSSSFVIRPFLLRTKIEDNAENIENINNNLSEFESSVFYDTTIKRGINLFNKNDARNKDDCYRNNIGVLVQATGTHFFITHPIAVKAGVEYKAIRFNNSYGENLKVFIVDASGENVLGSFDATAWTSPIEREQFITFTPPETCFIQLNLGSQASSYKGYQKDFCVVCESANLPDEPIYQNYVPYQTDIISIDNKDHKQTISDVNYIKSCNLIDKRSPDVLTNCYISTAITSANNYYISAPIKVKKGVKYLLTHAAGLGSGRRYIYLNENLEPFTESSSLIQDPTYSSMDSFTARLSGYVRVNLGTNPDAIVMCEYDNYNGYYAEYGFTLPNMKYPQLYGKIVSFNGDSICQGAGYAGGYGKIIAERNAMIYENIGIGGGTITAETYYSDGKPRHWICRTIENMRADADYVILEGGVNDSVTSIGTVPDVNDYTSALDDTKYAQAFESMLKQALNRFKGKKIGYIAVHKCTASFTSNGNDTMNRYTIAINACKKWGIPVCDLNVECPPLGYVDSLKTAYTKDGDGWHPNEAGYKAYYVPKIESWMASL